MIDIEFSFDASGLETLERQLRPRVDGTVRRHATRVRDSWKRRVRVRTGAYRDSIHEEPGDVTISEWVVQPTPDIDYAEHQEFGTSRQAANPAMLQAVEEDRRDFVDDLMRVFDL